MKNENEEKLLNIIKEELEELKTNLQKAKAKWEIEKYENQISILKKIFIKYINDIVQEHVLYFDEKLGFAVTKKEDGGFLVGLKSNGSEAVFDSYNFKDWNGVIDFINNFL